MNILNTLNDWLWSYLLIGLLLIAAVWFTIKSRGVQFRMFGEMWRLLAASGQREDNGKTDTHHTVSSFQAFAVSIASRVGTGNLAGVATAIAIGGAGSVFWMWVIALLGSASAFVESTLAQLYKVKGENSFKGGPAYYIQKGLGKRWWAVIFAVLISVTFGIAFNSVQSNTMTAAAKVSFGWDPAIVGIIITIASMLVIFGGIRRISRFSEIVVPVMAIAYILLAVTILVMNAGRIPEMFSTIVSEAFTGSAALGGGVGSALLMGIKRGLFSNEAGEGSAPNVAATASVSHPVKQGLLQTLAVFTDTLLICTCTAFIILLSGIYENGESGIALTQSALESEVGSIGSTFVAIAVFFFAFTSIVSNYYYGETNLQFISGRKWLVTVYRILVGCIVMVGAVTSLEFVWSMADIFMGLMTLCNLLAIFLLGKYAMRLLKDYQSQRKAGKNPVYHSSTIPEIADETECWSSTKD
ncbi:MAG: alanine:cation symporter family protein [Muribaculaceae bacterium]|nr:alanine:cation symporter family protein [Muribaculaceae bacterium]